MRVWTDVENSFKEGRIIKGRVIDRIKGGLTVDVGVGASPRIAGRHQAGQEPR
ncbi:MAG: hypothetical protein R2862_04925 [Thermoanaerobaculia bacterium]